ncbi:DNA mismatch repair protein [Phragmitibacter flavus]|uniref:DNA mismatch repair protein n=1 Tax=Phragmitibacter flavus TaxID=2576071 RepID=A0A5R8KJ29_9BACT|nr:MutS family DNA mismatch repair protein [Phragmitibacter flavus]TLD71629.1 DNA mismatch repair protein [Phragmitibacter flavus]
MNSTALTLPPSALALYTERESRYAAQASVAKQAMNRWSNFRLFIFLAATAAIIWTVKNNQPLLVLFSIIVGLSAFIFAIIRHNHHTRLHERATRLQLLNREGIQRCTGTWQQRDMLGESFLDKTHPYSSDLDLFGKNSLFQWFNTARTLAGQQTLARTLLNPSPLAQLPDRQSALRELASKLDWRQTLEAEAFAVQGKDLTPLFTWAESPLSPFLLSKRATFLRYLPILTALLWALTLLTNSHLLSLLAVIALALQTLSAGTLSRAFQNRLQTALNWENEIATCKTLLATVDSETFTSPLNQSIQTSLRTQNGTTASATFAQIETHLSWLSLRNNPIVHLAFNSLAYWDLQWLITIETWRRDHGAQLRPWLHHFAEMETLASLSVIPFENPTWAYPELSATTSIRAQQLGHPLLPPDRRITNDFAIDHPSAVALITGSNMSGKSTFLRTVGLNLVLANTGAPVCAKTFTCSPMQLFTSMRIADDMSSGVSSFYAELLRIKMIVDAAKSAPVLYLVDEIFRGTNSGDRVAGAIEVLKSLIKTNAVGLVSTHDLELSKLAQSHPENFTNYHFSEHYTDSGIDFNYTIQPGPATTTNARHLIRMVGIDV